ncbi:MAG: TonB-dependent receptor [Woeseiaceae bacterium]|nr:TonB-dependent receptor [Woeseiaceae bacterium]
MKCFPARLTSLLVAVLTALSSFSAYAELEEITVTAQRREASLQEVPVSVSALSADDLEIKQVINVRDLQYQVPNLNITANTGTASAARVFLRGIGEDESRGAVDQAVGIYVDDIFIGRSVGSLMDLVDLERVEVLRGPQGTLYGRNSNGGAIKLISKKPSTEETYYDLGTTLGSDSRFDLRLAANWAVSESTAVRATAMHRSRDGFHRLNPNGDFANLGREVGEIDTTAFRVSVQHAFNDDWTMNLAIDSTADDRDPTPDSAAPPNDSDNDIFTIEPLPGADPCSQFAPLPFQSMGCFTGYSSEVDVLGIGLNITGSIGDYTFKSLTGYREMEDELASRISFVYLQNTDQDQVSQEFSLTSNYDGPFNWVGGVYLFEEDFTLLSTFFNDFSVAVSTESWAVFAHGTYDFTDALTLTAGVRYTDENKDVNATNLTAETGDGTFTASRSPDFSKATYNLALDYAFTEAVMGYVSLATGFKSGGASPDCFSPAACFLPVEEEEVETWEVGIRSDLADGRVRLNASYFFNTYEGLQISSTVPGLGFTRFNVDETEISGLEVEAAWRATDNLTINAILGWLDGEYTEVTDSQAGGLTNAGVPCPGGVPTIECAKGLELKNAPEFKGTLGFLYTAPVGNGNLQIAMDASFEDDSWSLVANSPDHALTEVDTLVNARIAYGPEDDRWQIALWSRNLTDETYGRAAAAGSFTKYAADPLTWGVDARIRF